MKSLFILLLITLTLGCSNNRPIEEASESFRTKYGQEWMYVSEGRIIEQNNEKETILIH